MIQTVCGDAEKWSGVESEPCFPIPHTVMIVLCTTLQILVSVFMALPAVRAFPEVKIATLGKFVSRRSSSVRSEA